MLTQRGELLQITIVGAGLRSIPARFGMRIFMDIASAARHGIRYVDCAYSLTNWERWPSSESCNGRALIYQTPWLRANDLSRLNAASLRPMRLLSVILFLTFGSAVFWKSEEAKTMSATFNLSIADPLVYLSQILSKSISTDRNSE